MQKQETYRLKGVVELFISQSKDGCSMDYLLAQITAPAFEIEAAVAELSADGFIYQPKEGIYKKNVLKKVL